MHCESCALHPHPVKGVRVVRGQISLHHLFLNPAPIECDERFTSQVCDSLGLSAPVPLIKRNIRS